MLILRKVNKINKSWARLTKNKRGKTITNLITEREAITTDTMDIKRVIKDYRE